MCLAENSVTVRKFPQSRWEPLGSRGLTGVNLRMKARCRRRCVSAPIALPLIRRTSTLRQTETSLAPHPLFAAKPTRTRVRSAPHPRPSLVPLPSPPSVAARHAPLTAPPPPWTPPESPPRRCRRPAPRRRLRRRRRCRCRRPSARSPRETPPASSARASPPQTPCSTRVRTASARSAPRSTSPRRPRARACARSAPSPVRSASVRAPCSARSASKAESQCMHIATAPYGRQRCGNRPSRASLSWVCMPRWPGRSASSACFAGGSTRHCHVCI